MSNSPHRSFEKITTDDLTRLSQLGRLDFSDLFARKEHLRPYEDHLRVVCLCQGAARHYVKGDRGVQDFDLWGFFQEIPGKPFPVRRVANQDFGPSKFGRNPDDSDYFKGRRIDVMGRSINMPGNETAIESVQLYLRNGRTESARRLAERPVIVLWPDQDLGRAIWDGLETELMPVPV